MGYLDLHVPDCRASGGDDSIVSMDKMARERKISMVSRYAPNPTYISLRREYMGTTLSLLEPR